MNQVLCIGGEKPNILDKLNHWSSENDDQEEKNTPIRSKGRPKGFGNTKESKKKNKGKDKEIDENLRKGHWSTEENKKYHWFLEIYNKHFIQKEMRRLDKIFKTMAIFIGSREAEQCRSHHQKMEKKYITFSNILLYLRKSHYGGEEINPILEDMNNNDVYEMEGLLDPQELHSKINQKQISDTPKTLEPMDRDLQMVEIKNDFPLFGENNFDDLMGNSYEMQIDFIDQLFY